MEEHPSFDWHAEDLCLQTNIFREECTSFFKAHHHEYNEVRQKIHRHIMARQDRPRNEKILARQRHV